jgi:UTP--glucose-1-phosphate uridylyltransferase
MSEEAVAAATEKMRAAGQHETAIRSFASALTRLQAGEQTFLPSAELKPAPDVPALDELQTGDVSDALARTAVIRLNGGLATSMGLQQPKSLLRARGERTFLEVIVHQILGLRRRYGVKLPLVLMNSQVTREASLAALEAYPQISSAGIDADFLQSMVPKLDAATMMPVSWPENPALEWCPPGHGDVYGALVGSGMLDQLLEQGFRYAMISNADNLGSTVDPRIAAHVAANEIPFLMEVVLGTEADRKGGHIALRVSDHQLVLRETAQTPDDDMDSFRDYRKWRYYNTNTLWVNLEVVKQRMNSEQGLELPVIVNNKTVDPRDPGSTEVVQLESAMGAAIGSFTGAQLLQVPRTRFVPVKTTDDLLLLRSDVYELTDAYLVHPAAGDAESLPYVQLDKSYYKLIDAFEDRFPDGPPSLRQARRFVVHGDVTFPAGVVVTGSAEVDADGQALTLEPGQQIGS